LSISPLDVRNQIFKKKLRGYDADEVKIFLDAVADRMEDMIKERETLEQENSALRERSNTFAELETTLRETMVTAQRISDEAKVNAQKEADNILGRADLDARAKIAEASKKVEDIVRAHDDTRSQTMAFVAKMRSLLEGQLSFLGSVEHEVRSEREIKSENPAGSQAQERHQNQEAGHSQDSPKDEVGEDDNVKDQGVEVREGVGS
jgi:cell division initiation protein